MPISRGLSVSGGVARQAGAAFDRLPAANWLRDTYGDKFEIITVGEPVTPIEAYILAEQDKFQLQWWARGQSGRITAQAAALTGRSFPVTTRRQVRRNKSSSKSKAARPASKTCATCAVCWTGKRPRWAS